MALRTAASQEEPASNFWKSRRPRRGDAIADCMSEGIL